LNFTRIDKVREQLSTTESQNTGRILDLKSMPIIRYNELYIFKHTMIEYTSFHRLGKIKWFKDF
jgi:hypothetical protein